MKQLWKLEPVAVMAVVQAGIAAATAFGLNWTAEQIAGVIGLSSAVLGVLVRSQVSPVDDV